VFIPECGYFLHQLPLLDMDSIKYARGYKNILLGREQLRAGQKTPYIFGEGE